MIATKDTRATDASRGSQPAGQLKPFFRVRALVQRFPLACYFAMAYGISWLFWMPYALSENGLGVLHFRFPDLLGSGELPGLLLGAYLGPLSSALFVTAMADGRSGIRRWARRLRTWRVGWRWYGFALLGVPAILILGTLALPGGITGFHLPPLELLLAYLPALVLQVFTTGVAEEPGWRDFALPRLQRRHGPLVGTIVLGLLWSGWHLPLWLTDWAPVQATLFNIAQFVLVGVTLSIVITWVFNRTRESLPLAMLIHSTNNNLFSVAWLGFFPTLSLSHYVLPASIVAYGGLALVLIAVTRGRLGYRGASEPTT